MHHSYGELLWHSIISIAPTEYLALAHSPADSRKPCYCGCACAEYSGALDGIHERRDDT